MAVKLIRDPEALEAELKAAHARNRELDKAMNGVAKERKQFVRAKEEAAEALEARRVAEAALEVARQQIDSLEKELSSEQSARASERRLVENAQALKRAFEAL